MTVYILLNGITKIFNGKKEVHKHYTFKTDIEFYSKRGYKIVVQKLGNKRK